MEKSVGLSNCLRLQLITLLTIAANNIEVKETDLNEDAIGGVLLLASFLGHLDFEQSRSKMSTCQKISDIVRLVLPQE